MLRNIFLYGDLAKKYGKKHTLNVKSFSEAIRAINANRPGFVKSIKRDGKYEVVRGGTLKDEHINGNQLNMQYSKGDFHISPIIEGSGGDVMFIVGIALVAVAMFIPITAPYLVPLGISLMIGGIGQMMAEVPDDVRNDSEKKESFYFSGPVNRTEQGCVLPLVYGRMIVGSTVVSAGIEVEKTYFDEAEWLEEK